MELNFTKMHGLGNDYIYLNCLENRPENLPQLAEKLSQRRYGVGADGLICICPSKIGDFQMEMYNADGSQGEMCGNGIRCVGKFLYDKGLTTQTVLQIETLAGLRTLWLHLGQDNLVDEVTVNMGTAVLSPELELKLENLNSIVGVPVSVGNPHFVINWGELGDWNSVPVEELGSQIECHPAFPNRTNVEFFHKIAPDVLEMRVWERGSGETFACGTGAAAVFATAHQMGLCGDRCEIRLIGGTLKLSRDEKEILLRGGATTVYEGVCGESAETH